jgi:hypothetical protein
MKQHELMGGPLDPDHNTMYSPEAYRKSYSHVSSQIGRLTGLAMSPVPGFSRVKRAFRLYTVLTPSAEQASDWWDVGAVPFVCLDMWLKQWDDGMHEQGRVRQHPFKVGWNGSVQRISTTDLPNPREVNDFLAREGFEVHNPYPSEPYPGGLSKAVRAFVDLSETLDNFPHAFFYKRMNFCSITEQVGIGAEVLRKTGLI